MAGKVSSYRAFASSLINEWPWPLGSLLKGSDPTLEFNEADYEEPSFPSLHPPKPADKLLEGASEL